MSIYNDEIRSMKTSGDRATGNRRLSNYISVISSILTGGKLANIKSTSNTEEKNIKMMFPYGFASFPGKGTQVQVIYNDGNNTIVAMYDKDRPATQPDDVIIYNKSGSYVKIDSGGKISIHGDAEVTGTFKVNGQTIEEIVGNMIP